MDIRLTYREWYYAFIERIIQEWNTAGAEWKQFRRCHADYKVCNNGDIILRSYDTIVAAIPAADPTTCYDFSRVVYGYTSTTNQHISKFAKQFNATKLIIRG